MAQSVTNEALWVKLLEMDKKLDEFSVKQKSPVSTQEPAENKPDFTAVKEEIITKIRDEILTLDLSNDSYLEVNKQKVEELNGNILKVFDVASRIQKQQRGSVESQEKEKEYYFNFWLFKVRKTSFVITVLSLLVFILTLFCMKQQNDYSLLMDEYYRQSITIQELEKEIKK